MVSGDPPGEQAYDFLFQEASSACFAGADRMDRNRVQRSNFLLEPACILPLDLHCARPQLP